MRLAAPLSCLLTWLLAAAAVLGGGPEPAGPAVALFREAAPDGAAGRIEWDAAALRAAAARGAFRSLPLRLPGGPTVELALEPFRVTGPTTAFVLGSREGADRPLDFDAAAVTLLRGRVAGLPGSHVFLALGEHGGAGSIALAPAGPRFGLASRDAAGNTLAPGTLAVFAADAPPGLPPDVPLCGVGDAVPPPSAAAATRGLAAPAGPQLLQLAVDTDHEFFSLFGDATEAAAYLVALYGQVGDIFLRDVDTRIELVYARVWQTPDDLFNDVDPSPLSEFRNYWNDNMSFVQRDVVQLLSGRRDYPFGGQAYVNALCGSNAYSVVGYALGFFPDPAHPSTFHYDIAVTAHELGHNAGTGHTHASPNLIDECDDPTTTPQRGTIMSYCGQTWSGGNANRDLWFHTRIRENIRAHVESVSCVIDDCNLNGIADDIDARVGTSADANANDVPDECEDCNANGTLDDADIANATSNDLDGNGVPDECQADCNGNARPDSLDIDDAVSLDLHGNGVPDECEADCDDDGQSDFSEIQADMPLDIDRNAVLDTCQDCDGDGTSDLDELAGAHDLWVASGLRDTPVRRFQAATGVLAATSSGGAAAEVDRGQDVLVTPTGDVLVSSGEDDRVLSFDRHGVYLGDRVVAGAGGLAWPTGLALAPDGRLLVASRDTDSVLAFDAADGTPLGAFVPSGSGGLTEPFGLAFGPGGRLVVTSATDEVLEFDGATGAFVRALVPAGANGGLDQPRGLTFKADGNLLVASFGTNEVLEYHGPSGEPLGKWAKVGTATRLTQISPWGVRVGPDGNVFVVRTGEDYGSTSLALADHAHAEHEHEGLAQLARVQELHLTNAQVYEFDVDSGNFLRTHVGGNDHGLLFPTGLAFVDGSADDCNRNGLPDECDVASGASADDDGDGTPDECEVDCNGNGRADRLDLVPFGSSLDCNGNRLPDECDIAEGRSPDCDGDGVPDECDVFDDLEADRGWTLGAAGDDASSGLWVRVDPNGTEAQPEDDHTPGGTDCFVTGQGSPGGSAGAADVDGGRTTLISPSLDLYGDPDTEIGYWRWFSNDTGGNPAQDVLRVEISDDDGASWSPVETVGPAGVEASGGWFRHVFRPSALVPGATAVRLRFIAEDAGGSSTVEAAIDDLAVIGRCRECELAADCDDGLDCTADSCDTEAGDCLHTILPSTCRIDGVCRDLGEANPANPCEVCDAATPTLWQPLLPGEVAAVELDRVGGTRLLWAAQDPGHLYDVTGGALSVLRTSGSVAAAACLVDDEADTSWNDASPAPSSGEGLYYLVRAQSSCGSGGYGSGSSGSSRKPDVDCP